MSFTFTPLEALPEIIVVSGKRFEDERGFFSETFRDDEFNKHLPKFVQENHSRSSVACFRGFHYQLKPHGQGKLVRCVDGALWDYIADIRQGSPTYGCCVRIHLSGDDDYAIFIPSGFAHAFMSEHTNTHLIYKTTAYYNHEADRSIHYSSFDVELPEYVSMSDKDRDAPLLKDADNNFVYGGK